MSGIYSFIFFVLLFLFFCRQLGIKECEDDDKDDLHTTAFTPPTNYIKISQGKIQLVHQPPPPPLPLFSSPTLSPVSGGGPTPPTSTLSSTATTATLNGYHTSCNGSESPRDKVSLSEQSIT